MDDERRFHELTGEVRELIEAGRIIEAIKRLRELKGVNLKEAKEWVDAARAGKPVGNVRRPPAVVLTGEQRRAAAGLGLPAKVQGLLRQGQKIEAIRALRDAHGLGLKQAHDQITTYLKAHPEIERLHEKRSLWPMLAVIAIVVAALLAWFAARS